MLILLVFVVIGLAGLYWYYKSGEGSVYGGERVFHVRNDGGAGIYLEDEFIMGYSLGRIVPVGGDMSCWSTLSAAPVIDPTGKKLYYVDTKDVAPRIMVMDTEKKVETVSTVPDGYSFVASMYVNDIGQLAYVVADKAPTFCSNDDPSQVRVRAAYVIVSKTSSGLVSRKTFEEETLGYINEVVALGSKFLMTSPMYLDSGPCGEPPSDLRKIEDGSTVSRFTSRPLHSKGHNVLVYRDTLGGSDCFRDFHNSVVKVDLLNGEVVNVFGDEKTYIIGFDIDGDVVRFYYTNEYDERNKTFVGEKKTFKYEMK